MYGFVTLGASRARDLMQAQRHLQLELTLGLLPVCADEPADSLETLGDGIDVNMQKVVGARQVAASAEIGAQSAEKITASACVVVDDRPEHGVDEALDVGTFTQHKPDESKF